MSDKHATGFFDQSGKLLSHGEHVMLAGMSPAGASASGTPPQKAWQSVLLFVVLVMLVPLLGLAIIKLHEPEVERETFANLQAIANLKNSQIENWLDERRGDVALLASDAFFATQVERFVRQPHDAVLSKFILKRFADLRTNYSYATILLFDNNGKLLLMQGDDADNTGALQQQLRQAVSSKQVQRGDLYRDESGNIHMDWIVPISVSSPQGTHPTGIVVLRVTAQRFIFPLIHTWPTASDSAETLLVRREGESLLFLNKLHHRKDDAMTLRLPLTTPGLPAAIAIAESETGTMQGKDYQGMKVLAAYRPVTGTNWFLITKIDRDEAFAPLWLLASWISLIAFFAVAAVSAMMWLLWRKQQHAHKLELHNRVLAVAEESGRHFQAVAQSASDAIITINSAGIIASWNPGAERLFGYGEAEVNGQPMTRFMPERYREHHSKALANVAAGAESRLAGKTVELAGLRKDGSEFPLELSLAQWETSAGLFFTAIIRDITERKQEEAELLEKSLLLSESQRIAHVGSWRFDLSSGQLTWSREAYRILGVSPDMFTPSVESLISLIHPDDRASMHKWIADCMEGKKPGELEFRIIQPDGPLRILNGYGELQYNAENMPSYVLGIVYDITECRQAEAMINEQLDELRRWQSATSGREGRVLELKHEINELLGKYGLPPRYPSAESQDHTEE